MLRKAYLDLVSDLDPEIDPQLGDEFAEKLVALTEAWAGLLSPNPDYVEIEEMDLLSWIRKRGTPRQVFMGSGGGGGFSLLTRQVEDIVIVDMQGNLTIGEAVLLLRNTVRRFIESGTRRFILNLSGVQYIDSAGLGELISIYTAVRNRNGDVKLLNLTEKAKDLLQMTKVLSAFGNFDREADAIAALLKIR